MEVQPSEQSAQPEPNLLPFIKEVPKLHGLRRDALSQTVSAKASNSIQRPRRLLVGVNFQKYSSFIPKLGI
jgi:hypothetical protein